MATDKENLDALVARINAEKDLVLTINVSAPPVPLDFTEANAAVDALDAAIQSKITPTT